MNVTENRWRKKNICLLTFLLLTNFHLSFQAYIAQLKGDTLIRSHCPRSSSSKDIEKFLKTTIARLWNFRNRFFSFYDLTLGMLTCPKCALRREMYLKIVVRNWLNIQCLLPPWIIWCISIGDIYAFKYKGKPKKTFVRTFRKMYDCEKFSRKQNLSISVFFGINWLSDYNINEMENVFWSCMCKMFLNSFLLFFIKITCAILFILIFNYYFYSICK